MAFNYRNVFGFDISKYQDDPNTPVVVDFQEMKDYGAAFVIIRVGQGNFIDREWYRHELNSRGILPRAAYWYYDPYYDPQLQVDMCLIALGNKRLEGRVWLDLEFTWSGRFASPSCWKTFLDAIEAAGFRTGIYTRKSWWVEHAGFADMAYFKAKPLWQAQYPALTDLMSGWEPMIHQEGTPSIGPVTGVESIEIDRNRWNSNFDFSQEWSEASVPQEGNTMALYEGTAKLTATPNVRVRRSYPDGMTIGAIQPGQGFKGDGLENGWMHVTEVGGVALVGWSSAQYLNYWEVAPPPPPPAPADEITVSIEADIVATFNGKPYHGVVMFDSIQLRPVE
jgi:hypothetical protein